MPVPWVSGRRYWLRRGGPEDHAQVIAWCRTGVLAAPGRERNAEAGELRAIAATTGRALRSLLQWHADLALAACIARGARGPLIRGWTDRLVLVDAEACAFDRRVAEARPRLVAEGGRKAGIRAGAGGRARIRDLAGAVHAHAGAAITRVAL